MQVAYRMLVGIHRLMVAAFGWRYRIEGIERLPRHGGVVLAVNHISYLDPAVVGYAALRRKRQVHFLAKAELFDIRGFGWLLRRLAMIPVDRLGTPAAALDAAVEALGSGKVVAVFPESTITPSFIPSGLKSGAARIAQRAGVPLVPVAIWGPQRITTKGRPMRWQRGVVFSVHIGEPVPVPQAASPTAVTTELEQALRSLVDTAAATYPQEPADAEDRWWVPAHLGGAAPTEEEALAQRLAERARKLAAAAEVLSGETTPVPTGPTERPVDTASSSPREHHDPRAMTADDAEAPAWTPPEKRPREGRRLA